MFNFNPFNSNFKLNAGEEYRSSMVDQYNTELTEEENKRFLSWARDHYGIPDGEGGDFIRKQMNDYDLQGAWKENETNQSDNGHFSSKYKKPNHPTFSDESIYAEGNNPGMWREREDGWHYYPNKNSKYSKKYLEDYFSKYDPEAILDYSDYSDPIDKNTNPYDTE